MQYSQRFNVDSWCENYKAPLLFFMLLTMGLLSACSLLNFFGHSTPLKKIQVIAEINANQNTATAIDVVFVYDDATVSVLPKTSPEWFAKKTTLMLSLATHIEVASLQVPPATLADVELPANHSKAVGVYSYINYVDISGQAVGNLTPYKTMNIWLAPTTVLYKGN